jgi:hypothetical protein
MAYSKGVLATMGSFGLIQSFTSDLTGETAEAPDENGDVAAYTDFNSGHDVSMEVIFDTTTTLPAWGASLTVLNSYGHDGTYYCRGSTITQQNKDYKKATIKAHHYDAETTTT